jgi:hypothetical protein
MYRWSLLVFQLRFLVMGVQGDERVIPSKTSTPSKYSHMRHGCEVAVLRYSRWKSGQEPVRPHTGKLAGLSLHDEGVANGSRYFMKLDRRNVISEFTIQDTCLTIDAFPGLKEKHYEREVGIVHCPSRRELYSVSNHLVSALTTTLETVAHWTD